MGTGRRLAENGIDDPVEALMGPDGVRCTRPVAGDPPWLATYVLSFISVENAQLASDVTSNATVLLRTRTHKHANRRAGGRGGTKNNDEIIIFKNTQTGGWLNRRHYHIDVPVYLFFLIDQLNTLPVPQPLGSHAPPPPPFDPRLGLPFPPIPIPFSYSHLLFNPTLARWPLRSGVTPASLVILS